MLDQKVLESFPAGSNPFHHDAISVGMTLEQIGLAQVFVMDSGRLGQGLYIYNMDTGQRVKITGVNCTEHKGIDETLSIMEPYLKQDNLSDAQAARIGRTLYANLRQAERDAQKDDHVQGLQR